MCGRFARSGKEPGSRRLRVGRVRWSGVSGRGGSDALLVVLGYSRLLWFQFYERQTMEVLMRGLEAAFAYFGGVPWELLFDQLAVIIEDRRASGGAAAERGSRGSRGTATS